MKLKDLIVTRSEINELTHQPQQLAGLLVACYESEHADDVFFYSRVRFHELPESEVENDNVYALISQNFTCKGMTVLTSSDPIFDGRRQKLLGNYGALLDYMQITNKHGDQSYPAATVYDVVRDEVLSYMAYIPAWRGSVQTIVGISKPAFNTASKKRRILVNMNKNKNPELLNYYFDTHVETPSTVLPNIEDDTVDLKGAGLVSIVDYIMQCMETECGDKMRYFVNSTAIWRSLWVERPQVSNKGGSFTTSAINYLHVVEKLTAVSTFEQERRYQLYAIAMRYLKKEKQRAVLEAGWLIDDEDTPAISREQWDETVVGLVRVGDLDKAAQTLQALCTVKLPSSLTAFDRKTRHIPESSNGFRQFMLEELRQSPEANPSPSEYLSSEAAREMIMVIRSLIL